MTLREGKAQCLCAKSFTKTLLHSLYLSPYSGTRCSNTGLHVPCTARAYILEEERCCVKARAYAFRVSIFMYMQLAGETGKKKKKETACSPPSFLPFRTPSPILPIFLSCPSRGKRFSARHPFFFSSNSPADSPRAW